MNLSNLIIHDISNLSCLKILNQEEKKKKKVNNKTTIYKKTGARGKTFSETKETRD
jgi:ABC-type transport system involved in cytochrome bd biosynthesis fused ATPase/permease subunit